jgi:hypothetical protein
LQGPTSFLMTILCNMKFPPPPSLAEIEALSECMPDGEGTVYLKLFCDGSWEVDAECQTIVIAGISCEDLNVVDYSYRIREMNPEWEIYCEEIVKKFDLKWKEIKPKPL